METIKERAEKFAEENWIGDDTVYAATDGYVTGAKEQEVITKKEMIDKAYDAYCKACRHLAPHATPNHICRQDCSHYKYFKQTMEE